MVARSAKSLLFVFFFGYVGCAISGDTPTENDVSTSDGALTGDVELGEERYKKTCVNCHGAAGKGVASYPKISGNEIAYTKSRLETYRDGIKIGSNSSLMIMMAKPLTDEDIANLAVYLKEATN